MYKQCRSERSAARQHELEQGLLAILATKRYEDISVTDICERMGIPRKSFYRYFTGKDGALEALIDHTLMRFESFSSQVSVAEGRSVQGELEGFFRFWISEKPLLDALERNNLSAMLVQRCVYNTMHNSAMPVRLLKETAPEEQQFTTMFMVCGLMSLVLNWHHRGYVESVEQMGRVAVRLLCEPLFPNVSDLL